MPSFQKRSYSKELLDAPGIPFADIERNMQELDVVNTKLGGHAITIDGVRQLIAGIPEGVPVRITEIGCGGGDNLRAIKKHFTNRALQLTGIDINPECIAFAEKQAGNKGISFICSDYRDVVFEQQPHIIFSSLFCHHFTGEELVAQLRWMRQNSSHGFFINDLHRHPLAYYSIKWLTRLFSKSYLVKNDAPLSVLRGFTKKEWEALLQQDGIAAPIRWRWAFRWLVVYKHKDAGGTNI